MRTLLCKGDNVSVSGETLGRIEAVLDNSAGDSPLYLVELKTKGFVIFPESRLTLIPDWRSKCECGSHSVAGLVAAHSRWCPAFTGTDVV